MTDINQLPNKPDKIPNQPDKKPNRVLCIVDEDRNAAMHVAAANGKIQDILNEIACGETVNVENYLGWTPLMMACRRARKEAVEVLLKHDADATRKNQFGISTFHLAIAGGNLDIIFTVLQHLLNGGVSRLKIESFISPLSLAALFRHNNVINFLLNNQSFNANAATPRTGVTPLMFAVAVDNVRAQELLMAKGADPNCRNVNGQCANDMLYNKRRAAQQASAVGQQQVAQLAQQAGVSGHPQTAQSAGVAGHPPMPHVAPVIVISPNPILNYAPFQQMPQACRPRKSSNVETPCIFSPHLSPVALSPHQMFFPADFSPHHMPFYSPNYGGKFMMPSPQPITPVNCFHSPNVFNYPIRSDTSILSFDGNYQG